MNHVICKACESTIAPGLPCYYCSHPTNSYFRGHRVDEEISIADAELKHSALTHFLREKAVKGERTTPLEAPDYHIVEEQNKGQFEVEIIRLMRQGYKLAGGPFMQALDMESATWCQAVYKGE